mmetsp:Transcript_3945/g.8033  ORF Transcript_3945/g.8033 Transcript_3945/m.8033 type:complete len:200 (-) Transcript_3945:19-618(-)
MLPRSVISRPSGNRAKRLLSSNPTLVDRRPTSMLGASGTSRCRSPQPSTSFSKPRTSWALDKIALASSSLSKVTTTCRSAFLRSSAHRRSIATSSSWKDWHPSPVIDSTIAPTSLEQKNSLARAVAWLWNSLKLILVSSSSLPMRGHGALQSTSRQSGEVCRAKGAATSETSPSSIAASEYAEGTCLGMATAVIALCQQ